MRIGKKEQVFSERELNKNSEKEKVITFALILRLLGKGFSIAAVESFYLSTRQPLDLGLVGWVPLHPTVMNIQFIIRAKLFFEFQLSPLTMFCAHKTLFNY